MKVVYRLCLESFLGIFYLDNGHVETAVCLAPYPDDSIKACCRYNWRRMGVELHTEHKNHIKGTKI
jgi:hypothetical protein